MVALYDTVVRDNSTRQEDTTRAKFEVQAKASDAPINLSFVEAAQDSDYSLAVISDVHGTSLVVALALSVSGFVCADHREAAPDVRRVVQTRDIQAGTSGS